MPGIALRGKEPLTGSGGGCQEGQAKEGVSSNLSFQLPIRNDLLLLLLFCSSLSASQPSPSLPPEARVGVRVHCPSLCRRRRSLPFSILHSPIPSIRSLAPVCRVFSLRASQKRDPPGNPHAHTFIHIVSNLFLHSKRHCHKFHSPSVHVPSVLKRTNESATLAIRSLPTQPLFYSHGRARAHTQQPSFDRAQRGG